MTKRSSLFWLVSLVFFLIALSGNPALAQVSDTSHRACVAPETWFPHSATLRPQPKHNALLNPCDFYLWSWQTFLWLTQGVNGHARFETFGEEDPKTHALVPPESPTFTPFIGRSKEFSILQAGQNGVLVDHNGRPVYYSIYVNDEFKTFVTANKLTDPEHIGAFDANTPFPDGTLELKVSWKIVKPSEDARLFYTRPGVLHKLIEQNGKIYLDPNNTERVTLALVGMHIVGRVFDHPEMIWASFEHVNNAPDVGQYPASQPANTVVSPRDFTFYTANTELKNCNYNAASANELELDQREQTLRPVTQVCRIYAYGSGSELDGPSNAKNIISLNASVRDQLNDVFKNYFEVGATWLSAVGGQLKPGCTFQSDRQSDRNCYEIINGSTHLSNSTIETFTQKSSTRDHCFTCHNTTTQMGTTKSLPGKDINMSHIILDNYFR